MIFAFILLTLLVLYQPSIPRMYAAITFTTFTLSHWLFLSNSTGLLYYGSAALFDVMIAYFISRLTPLPATILPLIQICVLSAFINAVGYFMYMAYLPPGLYDLAMRMLMVAAILTFIYRGDDVGSDTEHGGPTRFCNTASARVGNLFKGKGTM